MLVRKITYAFLFCLVCMSCSHRQNNNTIDSTATDELGEDTVVIKSILGNPKDEMSDILYSNYVITGQSARQEIVGKFDGIHTDTVYIEGKFEQSDENGFSTRYFLASRSGRLPWVEIWGRNEMYPLIYEEGDLDGNGTDEIGYLHTWINSQWRYYRILTFHNNQWMYMFSETEDCFSTSQCFRLSDNEIAKPGPKKGQVYVRYMTQGTRAEIKDTIITPNLTAIEIEK
jgi:hypothetical protein